MSLGMIFLEYTITKGSFWVEKPEKIQSEIKEKGQESGAKRESTQAALSVCKGSKCKRVGVI